ncbi:hypothetical protein SK128_003315 [Halocaridina rubra]|uniref:Uncharacterized protein n=1 Tax=Halocaridina rubra TaxID=373956 RepID=A0AAN8X2W0_HALRR
MERIDALDENMKAAMMDLHQNHEQRTQMLIQIQGDTRNLLRKTLETLYIGIQECINFKSAHVQDVVNSISLQFEAARLKHNSLYKLREDLVEVVNDAALPAASFDIGEKTLNSGHSMSDLEDFARQTGECVETMNQSFEKYIACINEIAEKLSNEVEYKLNYIEKEIMENSIQRISQVDALSLHIQESLNSSRLILCKMEKVKVQIEQAFLDKP